MNVPTSAVICYIMLKINLTLARYHYMIEIEDNFQMPCDTTQQCEEIGFKGFSCVDNRCSCDDLKICQRPKLQTSVTKIGQNCTESSECYIEQSFCSEQKKCECIKNTISSNNKRECLNVIDSLGSSCEEDVQCVSLNGVCENKKCTCPSHMHSDKGICFKSVELGQPCQRDEECSITDFSSCKSNKCTCDRKYIKSGYSSKCLLKARNLLSVCSEDIQCTSVLGFGSTCSNGFCHCKEVFHHKADINKCVIDALLGEVCRNHSECHQPGGGVSRLECILGECKCKPAYFEDAGFCLLNSAKGSASFSVHGVLPYIISYVFCYVIV